MGTFNVRAYGEDISRFTVDLTDEEYKAVLKLVNALNDAWSTSWANVPSIEIERA